MSDEILKAIRNKKSAFYYWKAKGRPTDCLDPFLLENKITTQELRKICRLEVAQKRIQERNEIIEARSSNKTLFYKLINKQRGKLSRRIDELNVDNLYLNFLCGLGLGGKIGNINCCAPTCTDDVALLACNPLDIQTTVDIAVDFKAEIHLKILGNIARANKNSSEWRLAERQLQVKSLDSWFIDMKKICIKYNLENPLSLLYNEMSKGKWKKMTTTAVHKYWTTRINEEIMYYSSLKYISASSFKVGKVHPLTLANIANQRDINRIPIRINIATGTYILQTNRAAYNQNNFDPTCKLCD
ncbi:Hypothetical predicted protein [Mytilus galloprovincialis]|uniref:Uncharacterized protein n=1 Tax=Mytilus galloprovincialis TaxID=29158 RepID=A0A8B6CB95_MYTGA|nr:Hypothetical predicted protein [Mytilus galloprovincialis]